MRGGFTLPAPTPRIPPKPPFFSSGLAPHLAGEADLPRHRLRLARDLRGRHVAGRRVHEVARPVHGVGDDLAALHGGLASPSRPTGREPSTVIRAAARCAVALAASCSDRTGRPRARAPRPRAAPRPAACARRTPARTSSRPCRTGARSRPPGPARDARPSTVKSAFFPTPTSSTASAANRSPRRFVTSRSCPRLPVSLRRGVRVGQAELLHAGPGLRALEDGDDQQPRLRRRRRRRWRTRTWSTSAPSIGVEAAV